MGAHSNIVINLLGRTWETRNYSFEDVNITGPQRIAKVCKEMGVQRLVHMSHINAREEPEVAFLKGGSRFLATKYQGELAVKAEFPEATIFTLFMYLCVLFVGKQGSVAASGIRIGDKKFISIGGIPGECLRGRKGAGG